MCKWMNTEHGRDGSQRKGSAGKIRREKEEKMMRDEIKTKDKEERGNEDAVVDTVIGKGICRRRQDVDWSVDTTEIEERGG